MKRQRHDPVVGGSGRRWAGGSARIVRRPSRRRQPTIDSKLGTIRTAAEYSARRPGAWFVTAFAMATPIINTRFLENHQAPASLTDVLTTQAIAPLLNDRDICAALFPFLPEESERSPEEVRQVVQSPQFQQALATLSYALESGELGPLLTQLGLDPSAGTSYVLLLLDN